MSSILKNYDVYMYIMMMLAGIEMRNKRKHTYIHMHTSLQKRFTIQHLMYVLYSAPTFLINIYYTVACVADSAFMECKTYSFGNRFIIVVVNSNSVFCYIFARFFGICFYDSLVWRTAHGITYLIALRTHKCTETPHHFHHYLPIDALFWWG